MPFDYDAGTPKPKPVLDNSVTFRAVLEGQRALKDGGLNVTLGLSETEVVAVAKILAMRNFILTVTIRPEKPETFGTGEKK